MQAALFVGFVVARFRVGERGTHRGDLGIAETEGLEIGKRPIGFAEARIERDALTIGRDRALGLALGLQRVAVTEPRGHLLRVLAQQFGVDRDRRCVFADAAEHGGLEVAVLRIARLIAQQAFERRDRLDGLVRAMQDDRVVVPRLAESGGEFEAAREQILRVLDAVDAYGEFGEHADRDDVGRRLAQLRAQTCFGFRDAVRGERGRGVHQRRIVDAVADVFEIGVARGRRIARGEQAVAEPPPHLRLRRRE